MRRLKLVTTLVSLVALLLPLAGTGVAAAQEPAFSALLFSKTAGFRHGSIPDGIAAIQQLADDHDFAVTATEDAGAFTEENLAQYDVVIWLSTTGDVLDEEQQAAFEAYIQGGGGYAGIHAASDTEYEWGWYGELVGAYFDGHPPGTPDATVEVHDDAHPSTAHLPQVWDRTDEWYNYDPNPRGNVHVLATLEESSFSGGTMGADHPIAWCQDYDGGRSWYTGGGHTSGSFSEPLFVEHLLGGIQTAAGVVDADCGGTVWDSFEQITLAQGEAQTGEPMGMAVLPDGRVLHSSRGGDIYLTDPAGGTTLAADIPVYTHDEDGLQGIAIDPDFAENGWVYAYYAPPLDTPAGDAPEDGAGPETFEPYEGHNNLSRFQFDSESGTIDLASEQVILTVDQDRGICCHNGGDIDFDAEGNLYLSTGDDSNPFQSDGYTPIDERPTRNPSFDAQRAPGNTNDLRGKILRISVNPDGSYDIPEGNLFAEGTEDTRPEIYAMGFRNPYRIDVDPETGWVLIGDYGPDAGSADPDRGPGGQVEFTVVREPGNYGWPYCTGDNDAYHDYDFATGESGPEFDCAGGPTNDSPRNDGLAELPPAIPATLPYDGGSVPDLGGGSESPMGGPIYRYDAELESDTKFPASYDGHWFMYEWGRGWIKDTVLTDDGDVLEINDFLPDMDLIRPMDVEFGPEGSLYVLDYGSGYFGGAPDSALYRIDYVEGSRAPVVELGADQTSGLAPLTVQFSSDGTVDPDGDEVTYAWDFGDGETSTEPNPTHTYAENGTYTARLTVTDATDRTSVATVTITVGNTAPTVEITTPVNGGFYEGDDVIPYTVTVTDPEDGEIDCARVEVQFILGHDDHGHPLTSTTGCEGTVTAPTDEGHGKSANTFGILNASYTDEGGEGAGALTGEDLVFLQPKTTQAEHYDDQSGIQVVNQGGAQGGARVGYIEPGDWLLFEPINLAGIDSVVPTVSSSAAASFELRSGAPDGALVATVEVPNTGGYDNYQQLDPVEITDPGGTNALYVVFTSGGQDLDELAFVGAGVVGNSRPAVTLSAVPTEGVAPLQVAFDGTVTDPEGDPVTYSWDFGVDGAEDPGTEDATFTYDEPGTYTATLTATDENSGSRSASVQVNVLAEAPTCLTPGSDEFDGDSLNTDRWSSIVRDTPALREVSDGALRLDTGDGTDMYGGNTTAQNLVMQPAPDGVWTATTKLSLDLGSKTYEQAGLLVHGDDENWAKLTFIQYPNSRNLEFTLQEDGSPIHDAAVDNSVIPASFPDTIFLRLTSNGDSLSAAYSANGVDWTETGRVRSLDALEDPQVGVAAFNGDGSGKDAVFDWFHLVPASDEFEGDTLDVCRWTDIVRENPDGYEVADGALQIDTGDGTDMYGGNTNAENVVLQPAPHGAWQATTKVDISLTEEKTYEQAALMAYADDDNFAKLAFIKVPEGRNLEFILQDDGSPVDGGAADRTDLLPTDFGDTVWLRMTSDGENLRASWSADGETFTEFGRARPLSALEGDLSVGVAAFNGNGDGDEAAFDFFHVEPADVPPPPECEATAPDEGFEMLFDGTEASLENWVMAGPGGFSHEDDCTILSFGGLGLYYYDQEFEAPYTLRLDWKMAGDDNSGVFVGSPNPGDDPWVAVEQGEEIQIDATDDPDSTTGAIYNEQAAIADAVANNLNPPGEWNTYDIEVTDTHIRVYLNGVLVNDWEDDDPNVDLSSGVIGLQNHGAGDQVYFRDVQIRQDDEADTTAPTVAAEVDGDGSEEVTLTLTASDDESDIAEVHYRMAGDTEFEQYTEPVSFTEPGDHTVEFRAADTAGNMSDWQSVTFTVVPPSDVTPPTVSVGVDGDGTQEVTLTLTADDGDDGSGVAELGWRLAGDDAFTPYDGPVSFTEPGDYTVEYRAEDLVGNESDLGSVSFTVAEPAPVDACPDGASPDESVVFGDLDSGVPNYDSGDGCTILDLVDTDTSNRSAFMRSVMDVTSVLYADGVIDRYERADLIRAASRSDVGRPARGGRGR